MKRVKILIILIILTMSANASKYVCMTDPTYVDWLNGLPADVNDDTVLLKYNDVESCQSQCRETQSCEETSANTNTEISPMAQYYTETQKNDLLSIVANKQINSVTASSPDFTSSYNDISGLNGTMFVFPSGVPPLNGRLSSVIYSNSDLTITTQKFYKHDYLQEQIVSTSELSNTNRDAINNRVNELLDHGFEVIGVTIDSYKLFFSTSLSNNDFTWNAISGSKTIFSEGNYSVSLITDLSRTDHKYYININFAGVEDSAFKNGETNTMKIFYRKLDTSAPVYGISIEMGTENYQQSDRWKSNARGNVYQDQQLKLSAIFEVSGYFCSLFSNDTDLGGDLNPNIFSDSGNCQNKCFIQNNCVEWIDHPKCRPTSYQPSHPISDYTGKTVFTKFEVTWDCNESSEVQGDCLEYATTVTDINSSFDLSSIGWKSKNFISPDEAMASAMGLEQFQHLWSGWNGMCQRGILFDNSWMSDPMTLMSMAMMAYTGALEGAYGEAGGWAAYPVASASSSVSEGFDAAASTVSSAIRPVTEAVGGAWTSVSDSIATATGGITSTQQAVIDALNNGSSALDSSCLISSTATTAESVTASTSSMAGLMDTMNTTLINATDYTTAVTYGDALMDAAQIAMGALAPVTDDDLAMADDFMKTQMGGSPTSIAAVNYTQCMASIGLSLPNMIGYSVDSNSSSSEELMKPWEHPISMTTDQLAELMDATSESFVRAEYLLIDSDSSMGVGRYMAITALAYTQAGQVICGNGTAKAMNIINEGSSDSGGGISARGAATAAVSVALSHLPPPYNLVASIAFKVLTSVSSGNACTDEDLAMKWGIQQYKTNKAVKFNQCHFIESNCVAKWAWGACMRHENDYCCYDQAMSRIFVEGAKQELGTEWVVGQCSDIGLEDLKNISFRRCGDSEDPQVDKCFPQDSWEELNGAIKHMSGRNFDAENLTNSAMDSMPVREDPWGHTIGD